MPRVRTQGYNLSPELCGEMDKLIDTFIDQGILEPVEQLKEDMHVSPGFLIEKKNEGGEKKYRLLVDLRRVNARIRTPVYDIHTIASFQRTSRTARFFAKFDVKNAYYTRHVDPRSFRILTMKTASLGGWRYTQWKRFPQGLCCSPQFWCDRIDGLIINYKAWMQNIRTTQKSIKWREMYIETENFDDIEIRCYIDDGLISGGDAPTVDFIANTFREMMEKKWTSRT